ncbi:hypothetical protein PAENIP36_73790 [Paenibacillus sp. P36]
MSAGEFFAICGGGVAFPFRVPLDELQGAISMGIAHGAGEGELQSTILSILVELSRFERE